MLRSALPVPAVLLLKNPMYTNEDAEDVVPGYQSGGYVAIIAHK